MKTFFLGLIFLFLLVFALISDDKYAKKSSVDLNKPQATSDIWLDVNRFRAVFRNNGIFHFDVIEATQGSEWPQGSGKSPIFASGQWIATKVNGEIKVAAVQHSATEFQPGEIDSPGVALNPRDNKYRWYELRSDGMGDWINWPIEQGAPVDENGNPLLIGDQTIFSVWNDLASHDEFGTNPLGVEVRQTAFAFNKVNILGDLHFVKWQLVNKSGEDWDSTYFTFWQDPDVGDATDDLVGCDTILGLGFCYNGFNDDQNYGIAPPATGIDFVQGPIVDQPGSTIKMPDGSILQDKKMLQMTCFVYYDGNDANNGNPNDGQDVWNYMRGFWRNGASITYGDRGTNPPSASHPPTTYMFPGDPESEQSTGWLDYSADDRRIMVTTGPFSMPAWTAYDLSSDLNNNGQPDFCEPGVQEVVAAVMVAQGSNHLNSVTQLKKTDELVQMAYDNNYKIVKAPDPPSVETTELPNEVVFKWDDSSEWNELLMPYSAVDPLIGDIFGDTIYVNNQPVIIDDSTYNFYGYSIYQYSDAAGTNPVLIAHWDVGPSHDATPYTGERYLRITKNMNTFVGNTGVSLVNGKEYYFGFVSEGYLEFGLPKILASPAAIFAVTPRQSFGVRYNTTYLDTLEVQHSTGSADAQVIVRVIDPDKITGDDYEAFFDQVSYYRDFDGQWRPTGSGNNSLTKPTDLTGSLLIPTAVVNYDNLGTVDLNFEFSYVSPDGNWCDGVQIELPTGININYALDVSGFHGNMGADPTPTINGQIVTWGNHDTTSYGGFAGYEILTINVDNFTPPITIDYELWDDGWTGTAGIVDIDTSCVIDSIQLDFMTESYLNVRNVTTGEVVLDNSSDVFPPGIDPTTAPIVDGLQIICIGSLAAPATIESVDINGVAAAGGAGLKFTDADGHWDITDYSWFGINPSSLSKNGYGSDDPEDMQQDYEFRFIGELDSVIINDSLVYITKDGTGSIATFYGARLYDWSQHPLNPIGTQDRFLVRVPFEVWNVDLGIQVNYQIYDRNQTDPAANGFMVWNTYGRMYGEVFNTPYDDTTPADPAVDGDNFTWNHVWYLSDYTTGDIIRINYKNPLIPGLDTFTFTTAGLEPAVSTDSKKSDLKKVKVVPNPYYGFHSGETDPFNRWVQFTFLPAKCTVRIFTLGGHMLRKLQKDDASTPFLKWDLRNEHEVPVASGVFVYHIEAPGIGERIGKMVVYALNQ